MNVTGGRLFAVGFATGATVTIGACVSTVTDVFAELELPAASVTRTTTVWKPSASVAVVNGEPHDANASESTWHSMNVGLPPVANVMLGVVSFVGEAGGVIETVGAAVSTMIDCDVLAVLPAASRALTSNTCGPSPSDAVVNADVHVANGAASTRQSVPTASALATNEYVGVGFVRRATRSTRDRDRRRCSIDDECDRFGLGVGSQVERANDDRVRAIGERRRRERARARHDDAAIDLTPDTGGAGHAEANRWRVVVAGILGRRCDRQIRRDGVDGERPHGRAGVRSLVGRADDD